MNLKEKGDSSIDAKESPKKIKQKENSQQQPQQRKPSKQDDTPPNKKPYVIAGAVLLALIVSFAGVKTIMSNMGPKVVTAETPTIKYQASPDSEPVEVDVPSLLTKVESLEKEIVDIKAQPTPRDTSIAYLPDKVTALADFNKDEADFLKANSLYQVKEPIPYKKMYVKLSDTQYGFYALIDYGGAKSLIPIHYTDYKDLKPEGVTYFIVEYASVRPEGTDQDKGLTVGITIDPKWRENLQANYN